ncbi:Immunoglobulin V-set domain [Trinorchestia longiramus]|nr:Immunoglobulin V-set domain [Trinorchestia longiramus]
MQLKFFEQHQAVDVVLTCSVHNLACCSVGREIVALNTILIQGSEPEPLKPHTLTHIYCPTHPPNTSPLTPPSRGRRNSCLPREEAASLPRFLEPIPNKTVVVGRDVILPCSVDNLKGYKTILTIHHTIISKNPRFTLARNDHKHWYLRITNVKPSDRGYYMCQVNSDPMMSQKGFLEVQVPPDIIDEKSSSEVVVQEGNDVTLHCHASGSPKPIISWKREDGGKIHLGKGINLKVTDSEVLHIPKVSRLHMGAYLCIASNDVPPSVSKRITLKVQCGRFDSIVAENGYKAYMKLKIRDVQPEDFGTYGCSAKNSFGESNGTIKVYEIPRELIYNAPPPRENISDVSTSGTDSRAAAGGRHSSGRWQVMVESDEEDDDTPAITITPDGVINYDVRKLFRTNGKPERRAPNRRPPSLLHPPFSHSPSLLLRGISHLLLTLCVSCIIAHLRCPQLLQ